VGKKRTCSQDGSVLRSGPVSRCENEGENEKFGGVLDKRGGDLYRVEVEGEEKRTNQGGIRRGGMRCSASQGRVINRGN